MKWISFEDDSPENEFFLTCDIYNPEFITMSKINENEEDGLITISMCELPVDYDVTHWMKIPDPPQGENSVLHDGANGWFGQ